MNCITGDCSRLHAEGIRVASESYIFTKCDPEISLFGRTKAGDAGICIFITTKAVIFGTYEKGIQMEKCCGVIERMAAYLEKYGL